MNWRLNEGRGCCMYMLGYEDDGKATGISPGELSASIKTLRVMMEAVGAKIDNMEVGGEHRHAAVGLSYRETCMTYLGGSHMSHVDKVPVRGMVDLIQIPEVSQVKKGGGGHHQELLCVLY